MAAADSPHVYVYVSCRAIPTANASLPPPTRAHPSHRPLPTRPTHTPPSPLRSGKRSLTIELDTAEGRRRLWDLLRVADVVVDGYSRGVLKRFGFDMGKVLGKSLAAVQPPRGRRVAAALPPQVTAG